MKTIIHIGADKCGSSSLQKSFTNNSSLLNSKGEMYKYAVIKNSKIIFDKEIKKKSQNNITEYMCSDGLPAMYLYTENKKKAIKKIVSKQKDNLIFSCEGWLRTNIEEYILNLIDLVRPNKEERQLEIICFVRAPAYWINSAWWQWGIWDKKNVDFDAWLDKTINFTNWFRYLSRYKKLVPDANILVIPLQENINKVFYSTQDISNFRESNNINNSLPIEVIKLYLFNRIHRPSKHECLNDFLFSNLLSSSSYNYSNTPWVISKKNIAKILKKTNEQIKSLLTFVDPEISSKIIEDSSWWDINHFENKYVYDPYLKDFNFNKDYLKLSSDLLINLNKAIDILKEHNLLDEYMRISRASQNK